MYYYYLCNNGFEFLFVYREYHIALIHWLFIIILIFVTFTLVKAPSNLEHLVANTHFHDHSLISNLILRQYTHHKDYLVIWSQVMPRIRSNSINNIKCSSNNTFATFEINWIIPSQVIPRMRIIIGNIFIIVKYFTDLNLLQLSHCKKHKYYKYICNNSGNNGFMWLYRCLCY